VVLKKSSAQGCFTNPLTRFVWSSHPSICSHRSIILPSPKR